MTTPIIELIHQKGFLVKEIDDRLFLAHGAVSRCLRLHTITAERLNEVANIIGMTDAEIVAYIRGELW